MKVCSRCGRSSDVDVAVCPTCSGALITALDGATEGSAALQIDPNEELSPGTMVGDYEIEKLIGFGGMGIVYGAVHPKIGKRAAIKVLNARYCADAESISRFTREAQAVNTIGHANIVDIFAIGELADGRSYLVMEWLQGETLMDRLDREAIPRSETIEILMGLVRGLEAAHAAGVIHRDLKPENIFLIPQDEAFRVKLLDFGIAKLETRRAPTRKTATGMTVGTPLFMSPEQAKGLAIDGRTDIYSLGILAYAMVTRTTPFENEDSPVEILHAHISKPPRPPRELVPDLSPGFDTLILQMIAKKPEDRPPLAEIRRRLKALDGTDRFESFTSEAELDRGGTIRVEAKKRSRAPFAIIGAMFVLGAIGVFAWMKLSEKEPAPTPTPIPPVAVAPPAPPPVEPPAPPPAPKPGSVELVVEPATAAITVDGKSVPLVNGRGKIELPEGEYKVAASANGFRASEQTVAVTSAQVTALSLKLTKQSRGGRPPKKKGDVDAVVNPFSKKKTK